jgi:hypothetical protein
MAQAYDSCLPRNNSNSHHVKAIVNTDFAVAPHKE